MMTQEAIKFFERKARKIKEEMEMEKQAEVKILYFTGMSINPNALASERLVEQRFAARLLAYTKNTRLQMTPDGFNDFRFKDWKSIEQEIEYMAKTIPSSWEFVDIIFAINNVSRACAQQITRTRTASFAMQSQRVTDMSEVTWHIPATVKDKKRYEDALGFGRANYKSLVEDGESLEDARGVLPINVNCNLIAKYNLRTLVDLLRARDSLRVQGEYQSVARQMKEQTLSIWPWAAPFFVPKNKQAISIIESIAGKIEDPKLRSELAKAADLLKKD